MSSADKYERRRRWLLVYSKRSNTIHRIHMFTYNKERMLRVWVGVILVRVALQRSLRSLSLLYSASTSPDDTIWWLCGSRPDSVKPPGYLYRVGREESYPTSKEPFSKS